MSDPDPKSRQPTGIPALGARVKMLMKKAGVSQRALEEATGIAQPNISALINAKYLMSDERLELIAKHLGITLEDLVGDTVPKARLVAAPNGPLPQPKPQGSAPSKATNKERLPEGLLGFRERHGARLGITDQDWFMLTDTRFSTQPWVKRDDVFWEKALRILRELNAPKPLDPSPSGTSEEAKRGGR